MSMHSSETLHLQNRAKTEGKKPTITEGFTQSCNTLRFIVEPWQLEFDFNFEGEMDGYLCMCFPFSTLFPLSYHSSSSIKSLPNFIEYKSTSLTNVSQHSLLINTPHCN